MAPPIICSLALTHITLADHMGPPKITGLRLFAKFSICSTLPTIFQPQRAVYCHLYLRGPTDLLRSIERPQKPPAVRTLSNIL